MKQYIGFSISSSEYMLPILKVREIVTMPVVTSLPQLPAYIKGVTNLRGTIIPIVNLSNLLNSSYDEETGNTIIVIATGKITFGVIVDGITGVINVDENNIEPPENFFKNNADNIKGVAKLENKLIVLLDTNKLLPLEDMSLLEDTIVEVNETDNGENVEIIREVETMGGTVITKEVRDAKDYMASNFDEDDPRHNVFEKMLSFMESLSAQDYQRAETLISELMNETDSDIFKEVGKITRNLHNSINEFKGSLESGLQKLSEDDVPNAIDKLQFVITKTEDAANKTMGIVERYFEESDDFAKQINSLEGNKEQVEYIKSFKESLDNDMTSILTAQEFQDITGQTIKKVIDLVNSVETELLKLITTFGMPTHNKMEKSAVGVTTDQTNENKTVETISQSDVESLLSDFGF